MSMPFPKVGGKNAGDSLVDAIPSPEEIRAEIARNAERNRILRSLYRISRRLAERGYRTIPSPDDVDGD